MTELPTLICFGGMPWNNQWKRNQSMVSHLAQKNIFEKVYYVNPGIWVRNGTQIKVLPSNPCIKILQPAHFFPFKQLAPFGKAVENAFYKLAYSNIGAKTNLVTLINRIDVPLSPLISHFVEKSSLSIFDLSDDFLEFKWNKMNFEKIKFELFSKIKSVDIVISVNDHVRKKYHYLNNNNYVIRNATNMSQLSFSGNHIEKKLLEVKSKFVKIIGYIGTANVERIDLNILKYCARKNPSFAFVFVGNTHSIVKAELSCVPNVVFYESVSYKELYSFIEQMDVCIAPFLVNQHTKGNDLLKLHDYLALGKPVVCTDVGGSQDLREVVSVTNGCKEFEHSISYWVCSDTEEHRAKRKEVAKRNSWNNRIDELINILHRHMEFF